MVQRLGEFSLDVRSVERQLPARPGTILAFWRGSPIGCSCRELMIPLKLDGLDISSAKKLSGERSDGYLRLHRNSAPHLRVNLGDARHLHRDRQRKGRSIGQVVLFPLNG